MLLAGASSIDITPDVPLALGGGAFGLAQGTLHPLTATALWLDADGARALLVSVDLLAFDDAIADDLRGAMAAAAGVDAAAVVLACTHTHGAPSTLTLRNWGAPDPAYCATVRERLATAARDAAGRARPARWSAAQAPCPGVAVNRVGDCGDVVDDTLTLLRIDGIDGRPLALVANHAAHPVNLHGCGRYTPDFVHHLRERLRAETGGAALVYLTGAAGDLNPVNFVPGSPDERAADATAARIAAGVRAAMGAAAPMADRIALASRSVALPLQPLPARAELAALRADYAARLAERFPQPQPLDWTWAGWRTRVDWADAAMAAIDAGAVPTTRPLALTALRLGDVRLLAVPGEPFSAQSIAWRAVAAPEPLLIATLANGYAGYFACPAAFAAQRYEAVHLPRYVALQPFAREVADVVERAGIELLRTMAAERSTAVG